VRRLNYHGHVAGRPSGPVRPLLFAKFANTILADDRSSAGRTHALDLE
jgi:hypothetical protein